MQGDVFPRRRLSYVKRAIPQRPVFSGTVRVIATKSPIFDIRRPEYIEPHNIKVSSRNHTLATPVASEVSHAVHKEQAIASLTESSSVWVPMKLPRKLLSKQRLNHLMMLFLVFTSLGLSAQSYFASIAAKEQMKVLAAQSGDPNNSDTTPLSDGALPSEAKPSAGAVAGYKVTPDMPRLLSIPSLAISARVLQVGVDTNNEMQTPKSIYDTGWYNGSAKPGVAGAVVINGHRSGPTSPGVFKNISQLKAGDKLVIELGNGKKLNYAVSKVETLAVEQVDMTKLLTSIDISHNGLNLITCDGSYDAKKQAFTSRTIVYALQT